MREKTNLSSILRHDLPASIVVFFVAVPLCLGIALASGAPLFAGIIAGIVGGVVVGMASGSALGVTGPAAGLAVIVLSSISTLGSWQAFLLAVIIAGIIQLIMGFAKAGFIAYFFPSSVIKGMLTGIGLLIILKQIPHAIGFDRDLEGDDAFFQADGENTFSALYAALDYITPAAVAISVFSLGILIFWEKVMSKKHKLFQFIQGPLVVVLTGILINYLLGKSESVFALQADHLVQLPVAKNLTEFAGLFTFPDFSQWNNPSVYKVAIVLAIIASLETLLSVEATDKLDPLKRVTPTNRELKAQGLGNLISGMIGGLPVTQVIIRSSANINFGARTKYSAIMHGIFLLICAVTIAGFMNMIPLASLAAILLLVGYKLANPRIFKEMYQMGWEQFIPFMATIVAILLSDLLIGISVGLAFGIFYTLRHSYRNSHHMKDTVTTEDGRMVHHIVLAEEVSFFNKASLQQALEEIPGPSKVILDYSRNKSMAYDAEEVLQSFRAHASSRDIEVIKI